MFVNFPRTIGVLKNSNRYHEREKILHLRRAMARAMFLRKAAFERVEFYLKNIFQFFELAVLRV